MSKQAVEGFLRTLQSDAALAQQAAALKPSVPAVVELAQQLGYAFSIDEFAAVVRQKTPETADTADQELTEEELERVAGGDADEWGWTYEGTSWVESWGDWGFLHSS